MIWALVAACALASVPAGLRWLRIAQREHYLRPAVATFAGRWWTSGIVNRGLLVVMLAGVVGSWWGPWWAFLVPAAQIGPVGLGLKGRTSPLAWTSRLRRVAILSGVLAMGVYWAGAAIESAFMVALGLSLFRRRWSTSPLLALLPVEKRLGQTDGWSRPPRG